ncbi:MAG TPA: NFACT RNA binding domain-containing protein [Bacilli bacterium]|nr:NFACT RNA binding domain-containing protein [Bacilli bacterium]
MQRMYFSDLENFANEAHNLLNLYLVKIRQLSLTDYLFEFTKRQNIFVSCNNTTPFIARNVDKALFPPGGELHSFALDSRRFLGGKLMSVTIKNNDLVLALNFVRKDSYFKEETMTLMIELIPRHPNMFVINQDHAIMSAYRYSYDATKGGRLLRRGARYELPPKSPDFAFKPSTEQDFYAAYLARDKEFIKKQNYRELFIYLELKIKQKERLLRNYAKDYEQSLAAPAFYDAANYLLTTQIAPEKDLFIVNDKTFPYKGHLSLYENTELLFKKGRKLKRAEKVISGLIKNAEDELAYLEMLFKQILHAEQKEELEEIRKELNLKPKKETRSVKFTKSTPYFFKLQSATVMFGRNNLQNDFVTFQVARGNDYFFHIKDESGAHVVVSGDNTQQDLIKLGAEVVLALAKKDDGEVIYTQVKYVKKGRLPGLVKLINYKSIFLRNVSNEIKELVKQADRL